jgi:DNA-binding response OmpR family regulator
MRVLIIDDDDVARELLSSTLKQVGHDVFELATAIGATRAIFEHNVDAVVVDVMLPDISGDKLARVLRQNPRGASLAIVLVSSRPLSELQALAKVAQADEVVPKSKIRASLGASVTDACMRRSRSVRAR